MKSRREQVRTTIKKLLEFVTGSEGMNVDSIASFNYNATPAARTLASYGYKNLSGNGVNSKYFKQIPTKGNGKNKKSGRKRRLG